MDIVVKKSKKWKFGTARGGGGGGGVIIQQGVYFAFSGIDQF